MTKKDQRAIETMLWHAEKDISYQGGGTYNKGDDANSYDEKEAKIGTEGIALVKWIIEAYV